MAYKDEEKRKEYYRNYMKERRDWYRSHSCCTECGQQDAYTLGGRRYCFDCTEKKALCIKSEESKHNKSEYEKKRTQTAIEQGVCVRCKKRKAIDGRKQCAICTFRDRQRYKKQHEGEIPRHLRSKYNLCYKCGNELDGQRRSNGEKSKLCSACYNSSPALPKTRILYAPFCTTEKSLDAWKKALKKREELLSSGVYDYIPVVHIEQKGMK